MTESLEIDKILTRLEQTFGQTPDVFLKMLPSDELLSSSDYMRRSLSHISLSPMHRELLIYYFSYKNGSKYCTTIHHEILQMHGYDCSVMAIEEQEFFDTADEEMKVLLAFAKEVSEKCGDVSQETKDNFLKTGFTERSMLDVLLIASFTYSVNTTSRLFKL